MQKGEQKQPGREKGRKYSVRRALLSNAVVEKYNEIPGSITEFGRT